MTESSLPTYPDPPIHLSVRVASQMDDELGKQWRWECACGETGEWSTDSTLALPGARAHRDEALGAGA